MKKELKDLSQNVFEGDLVEFDVECLNINGEGVCNCANKKICVKKVLPCEKVLAKVEKVKGNFVGCKLEKIEREQSGRVFPACKYESVCGGCNFMFASQSLAQKLKTETIKNYFSSLYEGEFKFHASKKQWYYRNKVSFFVEGTSIGLLEEHSNKIVHISHCMIADEQINKCIPIFKKYLEHTKNKDVGHIVVRALDGCVSVAVVSSKMPAQIDFLASLLRQEFGKNFGLYVNFNRRKEKIFGDDWRFVCGQKFLQSESCQTKFFVAPHSFLQINNDVRDEMFDFVASKIDGETVVEGYSGAGLLSVILGKKATQVFSIEINPSASKDAEKTCEINGCTNVQVINGDFCFEFEKLANEAKFGTLVVDPPRSGCDEKVLATIKKCLPQKIVYISCNPYTLKQNLSCISQNYQIESFDLFDIFPQTFDIESVVVLKKCAQNV